MSYAIKTKNGYLAVQGDTHWFEEGPIGWALFTSEDGARDIAEYHHSAIGTKPDEGYEIVPVKTEQADSRGMAETLELYITTSDKVTLDTAEFAFNHLFRRVNQAARDLAKDRAAWHDDPDGDPEGYAEHHAAWDEQFTEDDRAAVVAALFERCDRIRQENILNSTS